MKKYLFLIVLLATGACTRDLTSLNDDLKYPQEVPASMLFTNAERELMRNLTTPSINLNILRLIMQYWQPTIYAEESQYDLQRRTQADSWWYLNYRYVLSDLQACKNQITKYEFDQAVIKNQEHVTDILEVVTFYYLVNVFGDIPYSKALDIENPFPEYDDAKTVYYSLIDRLEADIDGLDENAESFGESDIIFHGDVAAWKRFANSFKLKMAILIADTDNTKAKAMAESAVQNGIMTSSADNAVLNFLTSPPNTNPIWEELVQSGRDDYVANRTIVNTLKTLNDPRLGRYFTVDANGGYSGGEPGVASAYALFSHVHPAITAPDFPGVLMDISEVEFLLAEALERGFNVGGTAAAHYNKAVEESLRSWGVNDAGIAAYLAQPAVQYNAAQWKRSIGTQKWISLFNRGMDSWVNYRRLDFPALQLPTGAISGFPMRYTYPLNEQNVNRRNYERAAESVGGDVVETKLWWDIN